MNANKFVLPCRKWQAWRCAEMNIFVHRSCDKKYKKQY